MRTRIHRQMPLLPAPMEHPHSEELRAISEVLDEVEGLVEMDLVEEGRIDAGRGRPGMSAEQVLRAAIVQQLRQWTFDELAWHLADSRSYQAFCRIGFADPAPKRSTLQENIRKISASSWETIHRLLVWKARDEGMEKGRKVRIDSTTCEADVACDKIASIFEEHTDILHKRGQTVFGHKLCLAVGASSLVLDVTIERGNPADSTPAPTMIERQQELYDRVPRQVAFDGGFPPRITWPTSRRWGSPMSHSTRNEGSKSVRWSARVGSTRDYIAFEPVLRGLSCGLSAALDCGDAGGEMALLRFKPMCEVPSWRRIY